MDVNNVGASLVAINLPSAIPDGEGCSVCFVAIKGTSYPSGVNSFQLFSAFGPGF
jgi:hypothetical protein